MRWMWVSMRVVNSAISHREGPHPPHVVLVTLGWRPCCLGSRQVRTLSWVTSNGSDRGYKLVKRCRILIAEDDPPVAAMLSETLLQPHYELSTAESLEQTVQVATTIRPDVVLVGLDGCGNFEPGWRAATMLTRLLSHAHLIMIATSDAAVAEVGHTPRGRAFAAALLKPFHLDQLIALIDRLCPSHEMSISEEDTPIVIPSR